MPFGISGESETLLCTSTNTVARATGTSPDTQVVSPHPNERNTKTTPVCNAELLNILEETKLNNLCRDITLVSLYIVIYIC
jgi:hypothetical protein